MKQWAVVAMLALTGCQWVPGSDAQKIAEAKMLVREELVDPSSAAFENVVVSEPLEGSPDMVCGWVNARNRMGGYVGAEPFLVAEGRVRVLGSRRAAGWEGSMGACVAGHPEASARLMRDVGRALDAYGQAVHGDN